MIENLAKIVINDYGGDIVPLFINNDEISGTGLCNPSIFIDDKIRLILRHVEYSLYHSETEKHQSDLQGSLSYYHRDDVNELKTNNYYCELDENTLEIKSHHKIDTSKLDVAPVWVFIGLEDARIVNWLNKYYLCGVRRDTTTNGQGRMELSEIEINNSSVKEINRSRIEVEDINSYCEKNWMPVLTKPFHFVKWTNPTEIVKVNLETCKAECVFNGSTIDSLYRDIRGGTALIDWYDNTYLCITHETDFVLEDINGHKNVDYYHRFIIFNDDFTIKYISDYFNFMCGRVEFCIGLTEYNGDILITFGFQDNGSYLLKINKESLRTLLENELYNCELNDVLNSTYLCKLAEKYYVDKCPKYNHYYTPEYHKILKDKNYDSMLEIGIGYPELMQKYTTKDYKSGASLYMWKDYFKNCKIHGADIREFNIEEDRISTHQCNQSDEKSLLSLITKTGSVDFIIDDGSHKLEDQILTFNILSNYCNDIYIIEDINSEDIHKITEICPVGYTVNSYKHDNDLQGFVVFYKLK